MHSPRALAPRGALLIGLAPPEAQKKFVFLKLLATDEDRVRWQGIAENNGTSLSELMRSSLDGMRLRKRREPLESTALLIPMIKIGP